MKLRHEVVLYGIGGLIGYLVDAGVAQLLVSLQLCSPFVVRLMSIPLAATVTWWWNRSQTFRHRPSQRQLLLEWLHWQLLMSGGALVSYGVYTVVLLLIPALRPWPAVAVLAGSVAAAMVNFVSVRLTLYKKIRSVKL